MEKSANAAPTPQQPQPPKKFIKSSASIAATNASSGGVRDEHVVAVIAAAATATAPVENARRRKELSKQHGSSITITHSSNNSVPFSIPCGSASTSTSTSTSGDSTLPTLSVMPIIFAPNNKPIKPTISGGPDGSTTTNSTSADHTYPTVAIKSSSSADAMLLTPSRLTTTTTSSSAPVPTISFMTTATGRRPQVTLSVASVPTIVSMNTNTTNSITTPTTQQPTTMRTALSTIPKLNAIKEALSYTLGNSITITAKPMHCVAAATAGQPQMQLLGNSNAILSNAAATGTTSGNITMGNHPTTSAAAIAVTTAAQGGFPPGTTITKISTPNSGTLLGRPPFQTKAMTTKIPMEQLQSHQQQIAVTTMATCPTTATAVAVKPTDNTVQTKPPCIILDSARRPPAQYKNLNSYMLAFKNTPPPPIVLPSATQLSIRNGIPLRRATVYSALPTAATTSSVLPMHSTAVVTTASVVCGGSNVGDTNIYFANTMNQREQQLPHAAATTTSSHQVVRSASGVGALSAVPATSVANPSKSTSAAANNQDAISCAPRTINVQISNGVLSDPEGPIQLLTTSTANQPMVPAQASTSASSPAPQSPSRLPSATVKDGACASPTATTSTGQHLSVAIPRSPRLQNRSRSLMNAPSIPATLAKPKRTRRYRMPSEPSKLMVLIQNAKAADISMVPSTVHRVPSISLAAATNAETTGTLSGRPLTTPLALQSKANSIDIETSDLTNICNSLFDTPAPPCNEQPDAMRDDTANIAGPAEPPMATEKTIDIAKSESSRSIMKKRDILSTIRWRKNIGYVPMSHLVYVKNEFGLVEPASRGAPLRINMAFEKSINESANIKVFSIKHSLPLQPSSIQGNARRKKSAQTPPSDSSASNTSSSGSSSRAANNNTNKTTTNDSQAIAFNWRSHLLVMQAEAAPPSLFLNPFPSSANGFEVGMKLEAIDPQNQCHFCVCTIIRICGYRLRIAFDGFDWKYTFWCNADSLDIFPPGWCTKSGRTLMAPPRFDQDSFDWHTYLSENHLLAAPRTLFTHLNSKTTTNPFSVGMKLEADDTRNTGKLCVATVGDVLGNRILVTFDGCDEKYNYWTDIRSPCIHPVNWHQLNGFSIIGPNDSAELFDWSTYQLATGAVLATADYFQVRAPMEFQVGMKLEVVDKKNPQLIRPASIVNVDEYSVKVLFEGWPERYAFWLTDDDPDLHPVYWCERTGHALEGPPVTNYQSQPGCSSYGCRSFGHANDPTAATHTDNNDCPYFVKNWDRVDKDQPNRIELYAEELARRRSAALAANGSQLSAQANELPPTTKQPIMRQPAVAAAMIDTDSNVPNDANITPQIGSGQLAGPSAPASQGEHNKFAAKSTSNGARKRAPKRKSSEMTPSNIKHELQSPANSDDSNDSNRVKIAAYMPSTLPGSDIGDDAKKLVAVKKDEEENNGLDDVPTDNMPRRLDATKHILDDYTPTLAGTYRLWRRNAQPMLRCITVRANVKPIYWTYEQVADTISQLPGCLDLRERFLEQQIDGFSLLCMSQRDLYVSDLAPLVGQAVKVSAYIAILREELDDDMLRIIVE